MAFAKTGKSAALPVFFGKLPLRPDFVLVNALHPLAREVDGYVQEALDPRRHGDAFNENYDSTAPADFVCASSDQKWLFMGSLCPSRDASGRRYPIVGGSVVPAGLLASERSTMLLVGELFFEGLREHLAGALTGDEEGTACQAFLEAQVSTWGDWGASPELATEILQLFMEGNQPRVLEEAFGAQSLHQCLLNLIFYRDFLRRYRVQSMLQVVEIPLKAGRGETLLHACAWLRLLFSLGEPGENPRLDFLVQHHPEHPRLLLTFGGGLASVLTQAFGGDLETNRLLALGEPQKAWQAHRLYAEVAYALNRLLNDSSSSLSHVNTFLYEIFKKLSDLSR